MAFYEDKREHYGGALVLFRRNLAVAVPNAKTHRQANWYMRLKIGGRKGYVTRSTKLTIYEDAYEFAKSELLRLQQAAKLGHSLGCVECYTATDDCVCIFCWKTTDLLCLNRQTAALDEWHSETTFEGNMVC